MSKTQHLVILGGGLAAHSAAISARGNGYEGHITMVAREEYLPYDRTPLSKAVLQGKREPDDLSFGSAESYRENQIDVLSGVNATAIDTENRRVSLSSGNTLEFDQLLIATGADVIYLQCPGAELPGIHCLRTIDDALAIKQDIEQANRVLVIGAGFIGSEAAASARTLGKDVTLVDMASAPMTTALGSEVAAVCRAIHEDHGVDLRMGSRVVELRGSERVEEAVLDSGERIPCDMVIAGIGVRPCIAVCEGTPIACDNGILVDEYCETNVPGIYAAGDVANWPHPELGQRYRVEHFENAGEQGTVAGRIIAGNREQPFAPVPYFWSDQYDTNIQHVGFPGEFDEVVLRGDCEARQVTGFYLTNGEIHGAVTINRPREARPSRRLVSARAKIAPEVLRDPETDIRKLSREYR